jgi:single-strand DNA-binding protein
MKSVNKVILVGNVTRDPQIKETSSGQPVVTFGLATNREWTTKTNEKRSLAEYHNIAVWGKLAEICQKYLKKGKLIYVEGYLKTRSWESPEEVKMFRTEVVAQDMIMLNKRGDVEGDMEDENDSTSDEYDDVATEKGEKGDMEGDDLNF